MRTMLPLHPTLSVVTMLLALAAIPACSATSGSALAGASQAAPGDAAPQRIPSVFVFAGGTGTADWSADTSKGHCEGTVTWYSSNILMHLNRKGDFQPSPENAFEVTGSAKGSCNGHAVTFAVAQAIIADHGNVTYNGKDPILSRVFLAGDGVVSGHGVLSGPVCDASISLMHFDVSNSNGDFHIGGSSIDNVRAFAPFCSKGR